MARSTQAKNEVTLFTKEAAFGLIMNERPTVIKRKEVQPLPDLLVEMYEELDEGQYVPIATAPDATAAGKQAHQWKVSAKNDPTYADMIFAIKANDNGGRTIYVGRDPERVAALAERRENRAAKKAAESTKK